MKFKYKFKNFADASGYPRCSVQQRAAATVGLHCYLNVIDV